MDFEIYLNGEIVNTIHASESFAKAYCAENGYTYKKVPEPDPEPTTEERVAALEDENAMLKAQITAQSDQMDFYEDCIAEMASIVYA